MRKRDKRSCSNRDAGARLPRARRDAVLTMDVADEVVVYDERQHRGHCLNQSAAMVWRHLHRDVSMHELVATLRAELDPAVDEKVVWLAIRELQRVHLLEERVAVPSGVSRRQLLHRLAAGGGAVLLLPVISSVVAPPVYAQASPLTCTTTITDCDGVGEGCPAGCVCASTSEGTHVCLEPTCEGATACTSSAGCPPGRICVPLGGFCCDLGAGACIPICPPGGFPADGTAATTSSTSGSRRRWGTRK